MPKKSGAAERLQHLTLRDGVYQAVKRVNGRLVRRSLRTSDPKVAAERLQAFLAEVDHEKQTVEDLQNGRLSWREAVVRYHDEIGVKSLKPATMKRYMTSFIQMEPWLEKLYLHQISVATISQMVSARGKAGVSNATINRDITALSRVMSCGIVWGVCKDNPARSWDRKLMTNEARDPRRLPDPDQIEIVARGCPGLFGAAVRFARLEGARQAEITGLQWQHVDLDAGSATFINTKTSRRTSMPRTIKLCPESVDLLKTLPRPPKGDYVFWHGKGEPYGNPATFFSKLRQRVSLARRKAGEEFPDFTFHDLRHAFAVSQLKGGRDIYDLSRHLGHTSVQTTEIYLGYVPGGRPVSRSDPGSITVSITQPVQARGFRDTQSLEAADLAGDLGGAG